MTVEELYTKLGRMMSKREVSINTEVYILSLLNLGRTKIDDVTVSEDKTCVEIWVRGR